MPTSKFLVLTYQSVVLGLTLLCFSRVISASPIPAQLTVLSKEDWASAPYYSVSDALRGLTAYQVDRVGDHLSPSYARLMGNSHAARVLVLLDGQPLQYFYGSQVDLSQIPLHMLDRIEITEGGGSSFYSAQNSRGTIHLITKRPDTKGLDVALGTMIGRRGHKASHGELLGRSYWGDISYLGSKETVGGFQQHAEATRNDHLLNLTRSFNGKGFWGLEYLYHLSENNEPNGTPIPFSEWNQHLEKEPVTLTEYREEKRQHGKIFLYLPIQSASHLSVSYIHALQEAEQKAGSHLPRTFGNEIKSNLIDAKWIHPVYSFGGSYQNVNQDHQSSVSDEIKENGYFFTFKKNFEQWQFIPSVRYDWHSESGGAISPRFFVSRVIKNKLTLSSSLSRAYRAPTFDELFVSSTVLSNSNLKHERSWAYDLGVHWQESPQLFLKTIFSYSSIDDVISVDAQTNQWQNSSREHAYSVHTTMAFPLTSKIKFSQDWMAQYVEIKSGNQEFEKASFSPAHISQSKLSVLLPYKAAWIHELKYRAKQFSEAGERGQKMPGYYVWNMRYEIPILKANLFLSIENILNERMTETIQRVGGQSYFSPQPNRLYSAGITMRFIN